MRGWRAAYSGPSWAEFRTPFDLNIVVLANSCAIAHVEWPNKLEVDMMPLWRSKDPIAIGVVR